MKKIAGFVVLAYLAILLVLTWPMIATAFAFDGIKATEIFGVFGSAGYWIFIGILLICEAGLLLLPVKIDSRRPVARRHVFLPIVVAGFLTGALVVGVVCSVVEFIQQDQAFESARLGYITLASGLVMWILWGSVFYRLSRNREPKCVVLQQCKLLLQGGVIGLLVAVPTHIVARCRDYCCAGFYTFTGITFGIAVMLISFGPGIYFLYAARWKKLHPVPQAGENVARQRNNESDS